MVSCQEKKNNKFLIFLKKLPLYNTYTFGFQGNFMSVGELQGHLFQADVNGLNLAFGNERGKNVREGKVLNLVRSKGLLQTVQSKERMRMIAKLL